MQKVNIEFKARINDLDAARSKLRTLHPREMGRDRQRDTYFQVPQGRLKLREGSLEQSLIYYRRSDTAATRESHVIYATVENTGELRRVLEAASKSFCFTASMICFEASRSLLLKALYSAVSASGMPSRASTSPIDANSSASLRERPA